MSCKKGELVSTHHNYIRDLTANILKKVCNDVEVEAKLIALIAITGDEARLDIFARSFWVRGEEALLDPNANRYLNATLPRCHEIKEKMKKRNYHNRALHGTFTSLVFSIYGSMGRECTKFYSKFSKLLFDKRKQSKSLTVNFVMLWFTKILFTMFARQ